MIDATYLKDRRTASSLVVKKGARAADRSYARGHEHKAHAVTDASEHPISLFMMAGQVSDYIGAAALLDSQPKVLSV